MHRLREYPRVGPYAVVGLLDPTFTKSGWDKWERRFRDLVAHSIDPSPGVLVGCTLVKIHGQAVCSVTVAAPRYDEAYFLGTDSEQSTYYASRASRLVALRGSEMVRHWKDLQHRQHEQPSKPSPDVVTESPLPDQRLMATGLWSCPHSSTRPKFAPRNPSAASPASGTSELNPTESHSRGSHAEIQCRRGE